MLKVFEGVSSLPNHLVQGADQDSSFQSRLAINVVQIPAHQDYGVGGVDPACLNLVTVEVELQ